VAAPAVPSPAAAVAALALALAPAAAAVAVAVAAAPPVVPAVAPAAVARRGVATAAGYFWAAQFFGAATAAVTPARSVVEFAWRDTEVPMAQYQQ
jgi:hypothetical protein